jgi:hypothetical protein
VIVQRSGVATVATCPRAATAPGGGESIVSAPSSAFATYRLSGPTDRSGDAVMAAIDRADPIIMGHILVGHRHLHDLVAAARAAFDAAGPARPAAVPDVRGHLVTLRDHLHQHFVQEESGGHLEESLSRVPRLNRAVKAVLAEHPGLLAELDALIRGLPRHDISQASWDEANRDFETFVRHLMAHERSENAVVQEGYNEDLGLTD